MLETRRGWELDLPLAETGFFKAKAYLLDPEGGSIGRRAPISGFRFTRTTLARQTFLLRVSQDVRAQQTRRDFTRGECRQCSPVPG